MSGIPDPLIRFISLFFVPGYLVLLAAILVRATDCSMVVALISVFAGASMIMLILAELCCRFADPERKRSRYSISSLMMMTAGLAIYFAYIKPIFESLRLENMMAYGVFILFLYASIFIVVTTVILLRFTDAIIGLYESCMKLLGKHNA